MSGMADFDDQRAAARAMERIEAAGERAEASQVDGHHFEWHILEKAWLKVHVEYGEYTWHAVPWLAIRDDEQDPLEAAEQAAMEELKSG